MERHACKALSVEMWKNYTHKRLRSAMHSLDFYMPYLFTFQKENCEGMPNTNNKIEGTFTNLKKRLNVHSGMTEMSRKRLISEFFLALAATHSIRKLGSLKWRILLMAYAFRCAQSYSSWSCTPAELHYASDRFRKIATMWNRTALGRRFFILQFDL